MVQAYKRDAPKNDLLLKGLNMAASKVIFSETDAPVQQQQRYLLPVIARRNKDSHVERYFNYLGGWDNKDHLRTRMMIVMFKMDYEPTLHDINGVDGHASHVLAEWYTFVDDYAAKHEGRLPNPWDVADDVMALPDEEHNADFWEAYFDELTIKKKA